MLETSVVALSMQKAHLESDTSLLQQQLQNASTTASALRMELADNKVRWENESAVRMALDDDVRSLRKQLARAQTNERKATDTAQRYKHAHKELLRNVMKSRARCRAIGVLQVLHVNSSEATECV
jgi:uncharacterized membrane protein